MVSLYSLAKGRMLRMTDVASDPTRQNVQILLTTCLIEDLRFTGGLAAPASVIRSRLSAATTMVSESRESPRHTLSGIGAGALHGSSYIIECSRQG